MNLKFKNITNMDTFYLGLIVLIGLILMGGWLIGLQLKKSSGFRK